jgi:hypothetical protein
METHSSTSLFPYPGWFQIREWCCKDIPARSPISMEQIQAVVPQGKSKSRQLTPKFQTYFCVNFKPIIVEPGFPLTLHFAPYV